jgi:lipoprotein-releasing system ATP-binding protein
MQAGAPLAVEVKQLFKSYGDLHLLRDLSLELGVGELVAVVGPSGAGKSTLLHVLGGLQPADSGEIRLGRQLLSGLKGNALADFRNRKLGFVFQQAMLLPEFTAEENLWIPSLIAGNSPEVAKARAGELAEILGVAGRMNHKPSTLSGGEQQRFAVARALMNRPDLILADEPSGNLDQSQAEDLHHLFGELRSKFQQTLLVVTHNPGLAAEADRVLRLERGTLTEITPSSLPHAHPTP